MVQGKRLALLAGVALVGFAAWRVRQDQAAADQADQADQVDGGDVSGWSYAMTGAAASALGMWRAPAQYVGAIRQAEAANGLPPGLLERLLYQESHYRDDIISGAKRSKPGALGIAQFMPPTAVEWCGSEAAALDPFQAIPAAGRYLAWIRKRVSTWSEALAAYNWGIGNVQRLGLTLAPAETRAYYSQILADVNSAGATAYA